MNNNTQGRGGRGNRSGRGRSYGNSNNNNKNNKNKNNKNEKNQLKIPEEALKELGQNIYVINKSFQADKFVKTTEAIINCIRANYKRSEDIVKALRVPKDIDWKKHPDKPTAPTDKTGAMKIDFSTQEGYEYKLKYESFMRRKEQFITNRSNTQGLIYNQCTKEAKNKLEARSDYNELRDDPFKLLIALKELTHNYEDSKYYIGSVMSSLCTYFNVRQQEGESLVDYSKRFKNAKDIKDNLYGSFNLKHALERTEECKNATQSEKKDMAAEAIGQAEA